MWRVHDPYESFRLSIERRVGLDARPWRRKDSLGAAGARVPFTERNVPGGHSRLKADAHKERDLVVPADSIFAHGSTLIERYSAAGQQR